MEELRYRQDSAYKSIWQLFGVNFTGHVDIQTNEYCPQDLLVLVTPYSKDPFAIGILGMAKTSRIDYSELSQVAAYRRLMSSS